MARRDLFDELFDLANQMMGFVTAVDEEITTRQSNSETRKQRAPRYSNDVKWPTAQDIQNQMDEDFEEEVRGELEDIDVDFDIDLVDGDDEEISFTEFVTVDEVIDVLEKALRWNDINASAEFDTFLTDSQREALYRQLGTEAAEARDVLRRLKLTHGG